MSGEYAFTIAADHGIEVIPRPAFELRQEASGDRVSTGNADLDAICGGGFFKDSVVLVSGATGTGKTLIGCEFARAAVAGGERALLLSFEESRTQFLRNARSWGIDLEEAAESGLLRMEFRRPERMLLEDLLLDLRRMVDEFQPTRMVIDGLTSLERTSLPDAFREFSVSVTSFLKERETTVVFTETTGFDLDVGSTVESHLSTMTDVIILLRYVESGGAAHRALMVLKMRGSSHDSGVREYVITDDGLNIKAPLSNIVGFIPGAPHVPAAAAPETE